MASSTDLKALRIFIQGPVTHEMVHKLVVATLQVIPCTEDKNVKSSSGQKPLPSLMTFISRLVRYTNVYAGTLMTTLVYLNKLKLKLPKNAQGLPCTRHRIFLSCLILASKFHNDSSPKNVHWAQYTDGLFSLKDVNLMERQLLYLMNWDIRVSNEDMIQQVGQFLVPIKEELIKAAKLKRYLQKQKASQMSQTAQTMLSTPPRTPSYDSLLETSISRSSSTISGLSLGASHSRSSSNSSLYHTRQSSCSSIDTVSPTLAAKLNWMNKLDIDPSIEMAARSEEIQLTEMLNEFSSRTLGL
ncbi:hypothetical protein PUMCH_000250 [Australozyma saopauloensis]|uniref:Cyclin-like domain-containing protein n=1 Tax=Australozyma saopauloensis TaxID=291208 RepID=A0AAX4H3A3_9ASCO|nr:hypothetical protein PUMCH_000250 [[Candida] saopauloensis]